MSEMKISGYAVTYDPYPVHGGPDDGGWTETVDRDTLERAVADKPRVPLKMGDTVIGHADLSVDDKGLKMDATVNVGYTFRAKEQQWSDADLSGSGDRITMAARRITSMSLETMDISLARPDER
jgi:hypothetical protein